MKPVVRTLLDLVAIRSDSSLSNRPVIEYAMRHLDRKSWDMELFPYKDPAGVEKINLVAVTKTGSAYRKNTELALVCHTDTVPFDPGWSEAVNPKVRGGNLYGRGSCDVKGFLACVMTSVSEVPQLLKPLAIVLTADEEIGCVGAKFLARKKAVRSRYTIIGEPTDLQPVHAGKGYGLAEIVVHGREAHSAFPAAGHSAIYDAARVVATLERISKKLKAEKNFDFNPPYTTLNVGIIKGGTAKNIVPGECRITVEWRPIPRQDPAWASDVIRDELAKLSRQHSGFIADLDIKRIDPPFDPSESPRLAPFMESLTGKRATTVAFGTEAAHLSPLTSETIVFGPGSMTTAHKTGECVPIADLDKCVDYLNKTINALCK